MEYSLGSCANPALCHSSDYSNRKCHSLLADTSAKWTWNRIDTLISANLWLSTPSQCKQLPQEQGSKDWNQKYKPLFLFPTVNNLLFIFSNSSYLFKLLVLTCCASQFCLPVTLLNKVCFNLKIHTTPENIWPSNYPHISLIKFSPTGQNIYFTELVL